MTSSPPPYKAEGQYIAVCLGCGDPIKKHQKALRIKDSAAVDFEERDFYDIIWHFCPDCKERMLGWFNGGIRAAVERMKEKQKTLQEIDSQDKNSRGTPAPIPGGS